MKQAERIEQYLRVLRTLGALPMSYATISKLSNIPQSKLYRLITKLKELSFIGRLPGGVYATKESYDVDMLAKALGFTKSKLFKVKMVKCCICSELKKQQKKFISEKDLILVDPDTDKAWGNSMTLYGGESRIKAKVCPDCVRLEPILREPPVKMTTRKCRDCGCFLPNTRYFECFDCKPILPEVDDDHLYETGDLDFDHDWFESLAPMTHSEFNFHTTKHRWKDKRREAEIIGDDSGKFAGPATRTKGIGTNKKS